MEAPNNLLACPLALDLLPILRNHHLGSELTGFGVHPPLWDSDMSASGYLEASMNKADPTLNPKS